MLESIAIGSYQKLVYRETLGITCGACLNWLWKQVKNKNILKIFKVKISTFESLKVLKYMLNIKYD